MVAGMYSGYLDYTSSFRPDWAGLSWNPGSSMGTNFRTYRWAAELAQDGSAFYGTPPPGLPDWAIYLYPPITVYAYYPFTWTDWLIGYGVIVALNVVAGLLAAYLIVRYLEDRGIRVGWLDVGLIAALFALSPFSFGTMYYGNINVLLALAFLIGFLAIERDREVAAGVSFGLAALWKVFPVLMGVWLLRNRAWRSIGAAIGVGAGGLLAGLVAFGLEPTQVFFMDVVLDRTATEHFVGGYPPDGWYYITIQRPISQVLWTVWPSAPAYLLTPLTLLAAGSVIGVLYFRVETTFERLCAIFGTVVVTITVIPALQWYLVWLFFPMLPLMYLWEGRGRVAFAFGASLLFLNERPGSVLEYVESMDLPRLVRLLLVDLATFASIQLWAMGIMVGACLWHLHGPDAGVRDGTRQITARVAGAIE